MIDHYSDSRWRRTIDGKLITITIQEVEDILGDSPVVSIPLKEIEDMCIYKSCTNPPTVDRAMNADLEFPIIISRNLQDKYVRVLDGHHRMLKSMLLNKEFISARILELKSCPPEWAKMFS